MKVLKFHTASLKIRNRATGNDFECSTISRSSIFAVKNCKLKPFDWYPHSNLTVRCNHLTLNLYDLKLISVITFDPASVRTQDHTMQSIAKTTYNAIQDREMDMMEPLNRSTS